MIEVTNPAVTCRALKADEQTKFNLGSGRPAIVVSESGLYTLVLRSRKPAAQAFREWVTKTVLPTIRQTGGYIQGEEKLALLNEGDLSQSGADGHGAPTGRAERLAVESRINPTA